MPRKDGSDSAAFRVGEYSVRPDICEISGPKGAVHVEPRVMAVLAYLADSAGSVISRDELLSTIWGATHVTDDALTRCISVLRRVLGDTRRNQDVLQTIPKKGYRLVAPVVNVPPPVIAASRRRSRLTLEAVLASCSDHIYVYDRDGRYLYASETGAQAMGMKVEDLIGRCWKELNMPPEIMEPFQARVRSVFDGGPSIREQVSYPTIFGSRRYEYILDPVLDDDQRVTAVVAFVREITEEGAQP